MFAALASGLGLSLAFPPVDAGWIAFVALVPLCLALRGASGRLGALIGFVFGLGFFGVLLYWISYFGTVAFIVLLITESGILAAFGALAARASRRSVGARLAGMPLLWAGAEILRGRQPVGGFTWGSLGYSQHGGGPVRSIARVGGVIVVGVVVFAINALIAEMLTARPGIARRWAGAIALFLAVTPTFLPLGLAGPSAGTFSIAAVQGNVPRERFTGLGRRGRVGPEDFTIVANHVAESEALVGGPRPDLVVWAENSVDRDPRETPALFNPIQDLVRRVGVPFLVGSILEERPRFTNSNLLLDPNGDIVQRYDKRHLVPFGEYVPWDGFRRIVPALDRELPVNGRAGRTPGIFRVGPARIGSLICFESTYAGLGRDVVRAGAQIIVVSTNNASLGTSPAPREHLAMSQMRAVETGRAVVHAAISGISAIILPNGDVTQQSHVFTAAILRAGLPLATKDTPFTRFGGVVEALLIAGAVVTVLLALLRPRREQASPVQRDADRDRQGMVCVIIPTFNEAGTIEEVISRVLASAPTADVLVIDDNSPDGTGALVDALARDDPRISVVHQAAKGGLGPAYLAGFAVALRSPYELILEMDADLSHDPADVARLIEAAAGADLVIGSRYVPGGATRNWSRGREMLSRAGNRYARTLLGLPAADATSGFRCIRRAVLESLPLDRIRSEGYAFQIETAWRAWLAGFRIAEVPIVFTERREGRSKMSRRIVAEAILSISRWSAKRARPSGTPHSRSVVAGAPKDPARAETR